MPAPAGPPPPTEFQVSGRRREEWEAVRSELEADRMRRKEEEEARRGAGGAGGERSLYDVLVANKGLFRSEALFCVRHPIAVGLVARPRWLRGCECHMALAQCA